MQKVKNIKSVHIELTDKCQAQCPMCARNYHGGATRPFIRNGDISLEQFKEWFPRDFLAQLDNFYSCGNYGDPAFARDCLEIYSYVRKCNPTTRLALHTNGGMRNSSWWQQLAIALGDNSEVIFAVDGFKGKHELYRRNTNFDKVIGNLKAFIDAGGKARVDSLVFSHNEHETEELEKFLLELGVSKVNFISTMRFYEMKEFAVLDLNGNFEYSLKPAQTEKYKRIPNKTLTSLLDEDYRNRVIEHSVIRPGCVKEQEIYIDPYGDIFPCCWVGGDSIEVPVKESMPIHQLRNISVNSTKEMLKEIGVPNCQDKILFEDNNLWENIDKFWQGKNKCMTCARHCSTLIYDKYKK